MGTIIKLPTGQQVQMPDSFGSMAPEEQADAVKKVMAAVSSQGEQPPEAGQTPIGQDQAPNVVHTGQPSGSPVTAAYESLVDGIPAALEGGAATLGRTFDKGDEQKWAQLDQAAEAHRAAQAAAYQRPADVAASPTDALLHGHPLQALRSIGYSAAENAAPMGVPLALSAVPYVGLPLAATLGGTEAADGVAQSKKAAGVKSDGSLNLPDGINVATQALLAGLPVGKVGAPVTGYVADKLGQAFLHDMGPKIGGALAHGAAAGAKVATNATGAYVKGAGQNLANSLSLAEQGGDVGSLGDVMRNASDSGLANAGVDTGMRLPGASAAVARHGSQTLADQVRVHATDFGAGVKELQAAQKYAEENPGKQPLELSDNALNAQKQIDYLRAIRDRETSQNGEATGDVTAKGDLDARKGQIQRIGKNLKIAGNQAGGYTERPVEIESLLNDLAKEAGQHNRTVAPTTDGTAAAPSVQQRLNASSLPSDVKRLLLGTANVLDQESFDGLKKNRRAFAAPILAQGAAVLGPALGATAGGLLGSGLGPAADAGAIAAGLAAGKSMGSALAHRLAVDKARSIGERIDAKLGLGTPQGQKGMAAKLRIAQKYGIQSSYSPEELNTLESDTHAAALQALAARQQHGSARPAASVQPQQPQPNPVGPRAPVSPPVQPQQAPQSTPQAPQAPYVHTATELAQQSTPGWMAHVADQTGTTKVEMRSFLSNMLADRKITPEQYVHLMETDNIGDDINRFSSIVGAHKAIGTWARESAIRDPNKSAASLDAILRDVGADKATKSPKEPTRPDVDFDGDPVRNRMSYQAAARAPATIGASIVANYPHLAAAVDAMNNTDGKPGTANEGSRTPAGRAKIMKAEIDKLPQAQRMDAIVQLSRLVNHGYKGKKRNGG